MKTKRSVDEMIISTSPESESLRDEIQELTGKLRTAKISQGQIDNVLSQVLKLVKHEPLVKIPHANVVPSRASQPCTLVLHLTDWHIGLVTPASMVEEFNEYSWAIAQSRVRQLLESIEKYVKVMRGGYTLDDCVVLCTGDYISGDIHEGLVRSNEFPAPMQAVKAGRLMSSAISFLAGLFPRVRVEFIAPGNHDRLTKKPQAQAGGENSYGYVVGSIAQDALERQTNVEFKLHTAMQAIVDVSGRRYLCGHGDGIIGTWGIPFYGIERKKMREATARMNMVEAKRFHKIVIGHFHTGTDHEGWLVGGSLSGTDENDHKQGRHSPAHQTTWVVNHHGEFNFTRWLLSAD